MKVLFLDHDGVICLSNNYGSRFKKSKVSRGFEPSKNIPIEQRFDNFDLKAIKVLNRIIEKTDCEIVISSDWRIWATIEEMGEYYTLQGIIKKPLDFTPSINNVEIPNGFKWLKDFDLQQERSLEIREWVRINKPEKWVATDDLHLGKTLVNPSGVEEMVWGLTNFVWCPVPYEGIKQTGIEEKIIKFLE